MNLQEIKTDFKIDFQRTFTSFLQYFDLESEFKRIESEFESLLERRFLTQKELGDITYLTKLTLMKSELAMVEDFEQFKKVYIKFIYEQLFNAVDNEEYEMCENIRKYKIIIENILC